MSKLTDYGHWLVAAYFAFWGADLLWSSVAGFPRSLRDHPRHITYILVSDMLVLVAISLCTWGILNWQQWARNLGVVLSILILGLIALAAWTAPELGLLVILEFALTALIAGAVLIWLVLPVVRAEYLRRDQLA
ncbi:MAG: hypothetical protein WB780_11950 [Candidatus Acidiferrales bacterium]